MPTKHFNTLTIQDIRKRGSSAIIDEAPNFLIVNSKLKSVLISPEQYELFLEAMEELEEINIARERENEETIPHEEFWKLVDKDNATKEVSDSIQEISSKRLRHIPAKNQYRIRLKIEEIANNPYSQGTIKLQNHENLFRARVGDYRIIYSIFNVDIVIVIVYIKHRKEVYDIFKRMI